MMMAAVFLMFGCSGGDSPKAVAEKGVRCIQNSDYEGYVDLMYISPKEGEDIDAQKKAAVSMLESKAGSALGKKDGVKSYEVVSETIAEDGNTAKVDMKIVYGNGDEDNETVKLRKDDKGDWKLDAGK